MVVSLDALRRLLPSGWAFQFVPDGDADKILQGIGEEIEKTLADAVAQAADGFPATTTDLEIHERAFFQRVSEGLSEADRRAKIVAAWQDWGGGSPAELQVQLQAHGFPLYVWEWWTFISPPATSGPEAFFEPIGTGYVLRNGITTQAALELSQCGMDTAQCGLESASCLYHDTLGTFREYVQISEAAVAQPLGPPGEVYYPRLFILCGETFGDFVDIPAERREELEDLILKRRPVSRWAGILVNYV